MTLIIHAVNVHSGGGKSLLSALLTALPGNVDVVAQLDGRMAFPNRNPGLRIRVVAPSVTRRLEAEWWLARRVKQGDVALCFGNLPPLFKLRGRAVVYLQNRYLVERVSLRKFSLRARVRISMERLWIASRARNADEFVVQTPSMRAALVACGHAASRPIHILPITPEPQGCSYDRGLATGRHAFGDKKYDFVYVAAGEPHKNHRRLIDAWRLLAQEGLFPSLCITLDEALHPELCSWLQEQTRRFGLRLQNAGAVAHHQALRLYTESRALIYPSQFESFGLPLIEARQSGLPVVASELDYVRDLVDPEQSFDPTSALSIARSVKRFMQLSAPPLALMSPRQFLAFLLQAERPASCSG